MKTSLEKCKNFGNNYTVHEIELNRYKSKNSCPYFAHRMHYNGT